MYQVIDADGKKVQVHFLGWNSKFDEWYSRDSEKIQPLVAPPGSQEKTQNPKPGTVAAKVAAQKAGISAAPQE